MKKRDIKVCDTRAWKLLKKKLTKEELAWFFCLGRGHLHLSDTDFEMNLKQKMDALGITGYYNRFHRCYVYEVPSYFYDDNKKGGNNFDDLRSIDEAVA
ncbi:MAG: hypothetical protein JXQ76_07535 [Campylobacterales bacterium]|nr:hypothetical protein [Campylobacterales bacterium]